LFFFRTILLVALVSSVLFGLSCREAEKPSSEEFSQKVAEIDRSTGTRLVTYPELVEAMKEGREVVLLDVREPEEYKVSALPGARLVPPEQVSSVELKVGPQTLVVTYCTVGYRSGMAAVGLEERLGVPVYSLRGGIIEWFNNGGPVVTPAGAASGEIHPYSREWQRYVQPKESKPEDSP
jgi:rhodanese-related sulfurtransferase